MGTVSICLSITNISETVCWIFMEFSVKICATRMSSVKMASVTCRLNLKFCIYFVYFSFDLENIQNKEYL